MKWLLSVTLIIVILTLTISFLNANEERTKRRIAGLTNTVIPLTTQWARPKHR